MLSSAKDRRQTASWSGATRIRWLNSGLQRTAGFLVLVALGLPACSGGPRHAQIEGDAYLALDVGAELNLRDVPVHLITDVLLIDTLISPICQRRNEAVAEVARDTAGMPRAEAEERVQARAREATDRAWEERTEVLERLALRTVRTNQQAQFRFDSVAPGSYRLWSDAVVGEDRWTWLIRIRLRAGDSLRMNLTNANADFNALRCA